MGKFFLFGIVVIILIGAIGNAVALLLQDIGLWLLLICVGLPVTISIPFIAVWAYTTIHTAFMIEPNEQGLYPIPTRKNIHLQLPFIDIAHHYHDSNTVRVPQSFQYAPRVSTRNDVSPNPDNVSRETLLPKFHESPFKSGNIFLGYEHITHDPVYESLNFMASTIVGGLSGTGKTTLMRSILYQFICNENADITILDPHANVEEGLLSSFSESLLQFSSKSSNVSDILYYYDNLITKRFETGNIGKPSVLVIDELPALLRSENEKQLIDLLLRISSESRKVGVYAYCISQQWRQEILPPYLRNSFTNVLSTRTRKDVAELISGSSVFASEVDRVTGFQAVSRMSSGEVIRFYVPNCTEETISSLTGVNPTSTPTSTSTSNDEIVDGNYTYIEVENVDNGSGSRSGKSAKEELIISDFKLGMSLREIVIKHYETTGGSSYQKATTEVSQIIRENMK